MSGSAVHKALVLSHERAKDDTVSSYLATMLFPLRPIICWGRSAACVPECDASEAIWWWFKDVVSPLRAQETEHLRKQFLPKICRVLCVTISNITNIVLNHLTFSAFVSAAKLVSSIARRVLLTSVRFLAFG
jgi:hypothetical protein